MTKSKQTTDGTSYGEMEYTYNLSGGLIKTKYPSGREVINELDNDGRLSIVRSKKTQNHGLWDYAKGFTFTAAGAVSDMQLGNGKWESTDFNSRLQPTQISLGTTPGASDKLDLAYEYSTTGNDDNNGNVLKQTINVPDSPGQNDGFTAVQTYTYDEVNRIKTAAETGTDGWTQTFTYDRYGNKNFDEASTTTLTKNCGGSPLVMCAGDREVENPEIDSATNRIKELQPDGDQVKDYRYDAAGNTIEDPDGREFFYDGENKQIKVEDVNDNSIGEYFFDGDGKRVKKVVASTGETTIFHYDAAGKLIAEYSTVVETVSPQVSYLTNDHLGSPRITTDKDGDVNSRRDFLPFGEELTASQTSQRSTGVGHAGDSVRQRFTGYERDEETDLDFAEARMHSFVQGRFTSADPKMFSLGRASDPQRISLYSYARNNPLMFVDVFGEDIVLAEGMTQDQLDRLVDAMYEAYKTEKGKAFFDNEAKADTTLTLGVGDVDDLTDTAYGSTSIDDEGNITITLDLDAMDAQNEKAEAALRKNRVDGDSRGVLGGSRTTGTFVKEPPSLKEQGKHEVSHGIDARANPDQFRKDAAKEKREKTPAKDRATEKRRETIQNKLGKRKRDDKKKDRADFRRLIGADRYKVAGN